MLLALGRWFVHVGLRISPAMIHSLFITVREYIMTIIRKRTDAKASRIVIHNDTVYLCGQVPEDVNADFVAQTKAVLARVEEHLIEAGSDTTKMLSALIHVKDNKDVKVFNELWNAWVPEGFAPARTCVQSTMARDEVLVEVTVIAAL